MKITIEGTEQEFDLKKAELIQKIAGPKFDVILKAKGEKPFNFPRKPKLKAKKQMLSHYDELFNSMLSDIKADIEKIIKL